MLSVYNLANKVFKYLGPGFSESVYHKALCVELRKNHIEYDTERVYPIIYQNQSVGIFRPDLVICPSKDNCLDCKILLKPENELQDNQVNSKQLKQTAKLNENQCNMCEDCIFIVELKAISKIKDPEFIQLNNYLKHTSIPSGLLLNFSNTTTNQKIEAWKVIPYSNTHEFTTTLIKN